jgi:hypothetical protein
MLREDASWIAYWSFSVYHMRQECAHTNANTRTLNPTQSNPKSTTTTQHTPVLKKYNNVRKIYLICFFCVAQKLYFCLKDRIDDIPEFSMTSLAAGHDGAERLTDLCANSANATELSESMIARFGSNAHEKLRGYCMNAL